MKLHFKDYRILRDAEIEVKGLTVIRGENDAGKSCVMRGLHALVRNDSGDGHINYDSSDFLVSVAPREDLTIDYTRVRNGSGAYAIRRAGQDPEHFTKLNRKDLQTVFPESPFSLFAFTDSKFTPNFVFQKEVPVWGQVDAYAFFSSMFAPVASLSEHILKVRKEVGALNDADVKGSAELNVLAEQIAAVQGTLATLNAPAIEAAAADAQQIQAQEQVLLNAKALAYQQEVVITQHAVAASRAEWVPIIRAAAGSIDAYAGVEQTLFDLGQALQNLRSTQDEIAGIPPSMVIDQQLQAAQAYLTALYNQQQMQALRAEVTSVYGLAARLGQAQAVTKGMASDLGLAVIEGILRDIGGAVQARVMVASVQSQVPMQQEILARHSTAIAGIDICSLCLRPLKPGELVHAHVGDNA